MNSELTLPAGKKETIPVHIFKHMMLIALVVPFTAYADAKSQDPEAAPEAKIYTQTWTALSPNTYDAIIANVGGQILLMSDLRRTVAVLSKGRADLLPDGTIVGSGLTAEQVSGVFDELINQSLLEIKVKELSLELSETELDREIENFLESRQLKRDDFLQMLEAEGETEETHRAEFRRRLETQRFIGRVIQPLVSVTDEEVRSYYISEKPGSTGGIEKLVLRSLLLNGTPEDPNTKLAIEAIAADREAGKTFEDIVKDRSQAPDAKKNAGLLEARPLSALPPAVAQALGTAPDGTIAGPITIGSSTFFFERVSASASVDSSFEKEKEKWRSRLLEQKFAERLQSYLDAERSKVRIEKRPLNLRLASS